MATKKKKKTTKGDKRGKALTKVGKRLRTKKSAGRPKAGKISRSAKPKRKKAAKTKTAAPVRKAAKARPAPSAPARRPARGRIGSGAPPEPAGEVYGVETEELELSAKDTGAENLGLEDFEEEEDVPEIIGESEDDAEW